MRTSIPCFEEQFFDRLEVLLARRHPGLELEIPASGASLYGPQPDFLVSNPRTGSLLAAELRSGIQAQHTPLTMLPRMRVLRDLVRSAGRAGSDVVLITTAAVPNQVLAGLNRDGIPVLLVHSPEEAAERFGERLSAL